MPARKSTAALVYHEQTQSRLFQLPRELRDQVWQYAFAEVSQTPHLHIYDRIFDSCIDDPRDISRSHIEQRKSAPNTAVLRSCRRIHDEVIKLIYETPHFELVVFPGRARPEYIDHFDTSMRRTTIVAHNLRDRNCIGELAKCTMLRRIKHATIILQPGRHTDIERYRERLASFLAAIENGKHFETLCISLCPRMARMSLDGEDLKHCLEVLRPLNQAAATASSFTILPYEHHWTFSLWTIPGPISGLLQQVLPDATVEPQGTYRDKIMRDECYTYGLFRVRYWNMPPAPLPSQATSHPHLRDVTRKCRKVLLYSTLSLFSPLIAVILVADEMYHRKKKGQRVFR
ncbi:hypothetical protein LTR78_009770 [Recurvomyces mirabilis]|uniref:DUF7730 domain-containing protein n=1 Tax=Recurvomyces mirabilis TaxID=574656 RepID=A0AAE0TQY1_9PEZI|nr:hypothetical protein LTR78_009770 [Recurvomyces mirabilis]KAK5158188.1 hypothetical protein LTS14_003206 [Recurvomyces mirabilis]